MSAPKTVKVRIAVAVDRRGEWAAAGWSAYGGGEPVDVLDGHLEELECGERFYWVEAQLEVPEVEVVQGETREAQR